MNVIQRKMNTSKLVAMWRQQPSRDIISMDSLLLVRVDLLKNWYLRMPSLSVQSVHVTMKNDWTDTPVPGVMAQLPPVGAVFTSKSRNDTPCSPDTVVTTTPARYFVSPLNRTNPSWNRRSETAISRDRQPVHEQHTHTCWSDQHLFIRGLMCTKN